MSPICAKALAILLFAATPAIADGGGPYSGHGTSTTAGFALRAAKGFMDYAWPGKPLAPNTSVRPMPRPTSRGSSVFVPTSGSSVFVPSYTIGTYYWSGYTMRGHPPEGTYGGQYRTRGD